MLIAIDATTLSSTDNELTPTTPTPHARPPDRRCLLRCPRVCIRAGLHARMRWSCDGDCLLYLSRRSQDGLRCARWLTWLLGDRPPPKYSSRNTIGPRFDRPPHSRSALSAVRRNARGLWDGETSTTGFDHGSDGSGWLRVSVTAHFQG